MESPSSSTKLWMPVYIADYLADTCRLTTEQHGAYLLMIFDYWRNGPLPDDDAVLAQICRMSIDAWSIAQASLKSFFTKGEDGLLHQKRIDAEIAKAQLNRSKSVTRAKKAAEARWSKDAPSITPSNAQAMLASCPSPSPSPLNTNTTTRADSAFVLPDWIDREAWEGYEEMRKKNRKPLTGRAKGLAVKKLESLRTAGSKPMEVLNQSTMNGWIGLFPLNGASQSAGTFGTPSESKRRFVDPAAAYNGKEYSSEAA
jgi:uncharacterized protein YdaU (DUF1376 family)